VGLFSGDFSNSAWRLILFETANGDTMAFMDNTHPDAPDAGLAAPVVRYLDGTSVHFHLQPQAVGGSIMLPAYAWQISGFDPNVPIISESAYDRTNVDILPGTGAVVAAMADDSAESLPAQGPGPNFNSIAMGIPGSDEGLTTIYSDPTRYHHQARWAKGGEWVLFYSDDQTGSGYWNIIAAEDGTAMPFDPQFVDAFGTPNGYILVDGQGGLLLFKDLIPSAATRIYQGSDQAEVVYLTPPGAVFDLAAISDGGGLVVGPTPTLVINEPPGVAPGGNTDDNTCPQALAQRVSVGSGARVAPSLGALNVRNQPGGGVVASFSGGVTFAVIGGASCFDGLFWWQVQNVNATGWVAEGNFNNYYIEPWNGPVVLEPVPVPEEPAPPPSEGDNPGNLAPNPPAAEEPAIVVIVPEAIFSCSGSPTPRLSVGGTARVTSNSAMAVFQTAQGGQTIYELPPNVTVGIIGGPTCGAQNITYWQFSGNARNKNTNFAEQTTGWIPEGTGDIYWLSP
jgi:hypothetical protein